MPTLKALVIGFLAFTGVQFIVGITLFVLIRLNLLPTQIVNILQFPYVLILIELFIFLFILNLTAKQEARKNLRDLKKDIRKIKKS